MRYRGLAALACCFLVASCADRPTQPATPSAPRFNPAPGPRPTADALQGAIEQIYPAGSNRGAINKQIRQIDALVTRISPPPDTSAAKAQVFALIKLLIDRYHQNVFIGGQTPAVEAQLIWILNGLLAVVGLPPAFGPGSLGPDGSAAFIYPNTPDTTVVTATGWAGVQIDNGSVTQPSIVTIQRLPDSPGPLLTQLDQYPIYYEYHVTPAQTFNLDVVVAVCVADNQAPPDPSRLRLAHNVAPFTPGNSIEILPLASAGFINCTNAPTASAGRRGGFDLARRIEYLLLPQPLMAATYFGVGGVGGTVKNFSPFGAVDTLGVMTRVSAGEVHGVRNGPAGALASVAITTPTGRPMVGIPVNFAITAGGGSVSGASTATNASGVATVASWTMGPVRGCSQLTASGTMTPGSGLAGNPAAFYGCVR